MKPIRAAGVLLMTYDKEPEFLLMRHQRPFRNFSFVYNVPVGIIHKNEVEVDAAARIIHNETGFIIYPERLRVVPKIYTLMTLSKHKKIIYHFTLFTAQWYAGDMRFGETIEPEWIPYSLLASIKTFPLVNEMAHDVIALNQFASHTLY